MNPADLALMRKIDEPHLEHPLMGARLLRDPLARQGICIGRRRVRTLSIDIEVLVPRPGSKVYPYLTRKLAITRANQGWSTDATSMSMARGRSVKYERLYLKAYDSAARADVAAYLA